MDVDPVLWARLVRIDKASSEIKDLSGRFVQHKFTPLLKQPLVSSGRVVILDQKMRWDVEKPRPSVMIVAPKEVRMYHPDQKLLEIYDLRGAGRVSSTPLPRLRELAGRFKIEALDASVLTGIKGIEPADPEPAKPLAIRLTPLGEEASERFERIDALIDGASSAVRRMVMVDADGQKTVVTFNTLKANTGIKPERFELEVPPGTRTTRPLGRGGR